MLILSRKIGEAIAIGGTITVRVLEIKGGQAKLGVDAPDSVSVHREEVAQRILEENRRAAQDAPQDIASLDGIIRKPAPGEGKGSKP